MKNLRHPDTPVLMPDSAARIERAIGLDLAATPAPPRDGVSALPPESLVTATTVEEPLPILMAGMAVWGFGVTVAALIPIGMAAFLATPFLLVGSVFRRA
jgi:hypothetical protein